MAYYINIYGICQQRILLTILLNLIHFLDNSDYKAHLKSKACWGADLMGSNQVLKALNEINSVGFHSSCRTSYVKGAELIKAF